MFLLINFLQAKGACRKIISIHLMFLLIYRLSLILWRANKISIHLMFLLILIFSIVSPSPSSISIHLMFLLIFILEILAFLLVIISIHLMFLLIRAVKTEADTYFKISIHLMFLLIFQGALLWIVLLYFNTSHVSINLIKVVTGRGLSFISIHLMFPLITLE